MRSSNLFIKMYRQCNVNEKRLTVCHALKSNWSWPISALYFAYALANHRPEVKLDKSISQSATRVHMMSHHMSKTCETRPCASDFHLTFLAPLFFTSIAICIVSPFLIKEIPQIRLYREPFAELYSRLLV